VSTHVNPEGDAIGSLLALTLGLESLGMTVYPVLAEPLPPLYAFLPGAERLTTTLPSTLPDLGIAVDCDGSGRLGSLEPAFLGLPELVDIDHHASGRRFGTAHWVDPRAAAAGELVESLLRGLGVRFTPDMAQNLYAAIYTDTGRFSYSNTGPRALNAAARMVRAGAQPVLIFRNLYESRPPAAVRLQGEALRTLQLTDDGLVAWAVLTREAFAAAGAERTDTEGIIEAVRTVRGIEVGILFAEQADGTIRASLRSRGRVDVARLALAFGGGGHPRAAGCTLPGPLPEATARLVGAAHRALQGEPGDGMAAH